MITDPGGSLSREELAARAHYDQAARWAHQAEGRWAKDRRADDESTGSEDALAAIAIATYHAQMGDRWTRWSRGQP